MCYVPAHVGCSPNEMADACAKSHLQAGDVEDVTGKLSEWITSRPRVNETRTSDGAWALADRAMYKCARECAAEYARRRVAEGVAEGRATAGAKGDLWEGPAKRALEMARPEVTLGSATRKPTWEDTDAHNASVSMVMGLRCGDCVGVPHEREWERRQRSEGSGGGAETRSGEWGCAACRREAVERAKAAARGQDGALPDRMPKATMRHWLTGRCAAANTSARRAIHEQMRKIVAAVKGLKGKGSDELREVCRVALGASERAARGGVVTAEEWTALAQVMAAQLPRVEGDGKKEKAAEGAVDAARRQMVWAVMEQKKAAEEVGRGREAWRRQREEHRGWMRLVVRGWRTAAVGQREVRAKRTRAAHGQAAAVNAEAGLQPHAIMEAAEEARRESERTGRRTLIVVGEGRGATRRMVRASLETWWLRLRQRIRAVAAWAGELRGRDMGWIVRGEGAVCEGEPHADATRAPAQQGRAEQEAEATQDTRVHLEADGETLEEGEAAPQGRRSERLRGNTVQYSQTRKWQRRNTRLLKRKAVPAVNSTREGIRMWWWLEGGEGSDARGPISVERGRRLGDG